ncbi:MAG TPA: VCBS repeat-containing protein [Myxococcota bacterium]|nr:VCBS repeat-containing protein [Myxococcota bacterium]
MTCASDAECPSDARCNPLTNACDFNVGNAAPAVAIRQLGPVAGRAATTVAIAIDALDFNAPPVGTDTVAFTLEYSRDGSTWCEATIDGAPGAVGAETTTLGIVWDALADAQRVAAADPCALATSDIAASPEDGAPPTTVLAFADTVQVRITAVDSGIPPARNTTVSPVFAIGNDTPLLAVIDDGASLRQASPFEYTLTDSSLDESRIEVQFRIEGVVPESPWYTARVRGSTDGVVADAAGAATNRLLVWNADAPLPADTTTPGGIGHVNRQVTLRARAVESALAQVTTYGAWSTLTALVFNQTPPVVGGLEVSAVEPDYVSTLVFVGYEVVDAESDLVDIAVEYSLDGGSVWSRATPYPIVQHSGTLDVASKQSSPDRHTFVWNAGADVTDPVDGVRLRVIAADDGGNSEAAFATVPIPVGNVSSAQTTDFLDPILATYTYLSNDSNSREGTLMTTGDVTGDGREDCVVWAGNSLEFFPGIAGGGFGARTNFAQSDGNSRALVTADLNNDGRADILAHNDQDGLVIGLGGAAGPTYSTVASDSTTIALLAVGDYDGDGKLDVAINGNQSVMFRRGNGAGAVGAVENLVESGDIYGMTAGDFDGDGYTDIAYAVATGSGFGDVIKPTFVEVRVRYGAQTGSPPLRAGYDVVASGLGVNDDGFSYRSAILAAGDFRGDGKAELAFVDLRQLNLSRLRLFAREGGWYILDTIIDNMPPMRRMVFRAGPPAQVVLGNTTTAMAFGWNTTVARWRRLSGTIGAANDMVIDDRNGDGQPDILVAAPTLLTARVHASGHGAPSFPGDPAAKFIFVVPDRNALSLAADFDGDGLSDVWTMDARYTSNHVVAVFRGTSQRDVADGNIEVFGTPTFMVPNNTVLAGASDYLAVGDVNGDDAPDVVLSTDSNGNYYVTAGAAPNTFTPAAFVSSGQPGGPVVLGDFDGDGRDDALNWQSYEGVHYARGPAGSVTSWQAAPLAIDSATAAGDVDGDGVDDVVAANNSAGQVSVYFGGAGGVSAACSTAVPASADVLSMVVGDVAGRGANQVVALTASNIHVWTVGRCSYSTPITSTISVAINDNARLIDIDGDGVLDLLGETFTATAYVAGGNVVGGKPTGTFAPAVAIRSDLESLAFGDLNRDGIADLFAASSDDRLRVFVNHRYQVLPPWHQNLTTANVVGGAPRAVDRFGDPWGLPIAARPTVDREPVMHAARDLRSDFATRLRRSGVTVPATATAISLAWELSGHLASDTTSGGTGGQVHVRPATDRELIVSFPIYDAVVGDPASMLVYARIVAEYETSGSGALLQTADGRTQWRAVDTFIAVTPDADGNLATGTGPRFVYDAGTRTIRVATDSLGVFRAYATP